MAVSDGDVRILAIVRGSGLRPAGIEPDGTDRLALLVSGDILVARPTPACGS